MFSHAVSANRHTSILHYSIPEKLRSGTPFLVAVQIGYPFKPYHFRYLRICMIAGKHILFFYKRIKNKSMRETFGQFQIFFITGNGIYIGKHLVQSAMLTSQHILDLLISKSGHDIHHPVRKCHQHTFSFFLTSHEICISQSGISFMDVIEWNPSIV